MLLCLRGKIIYYTYYGLISLSADGHIDTEDNRVNSIDRHQTCILLDCEILKY